MITCALVAKLRCLGPMSTWPFRRFCFRWIQKQYSGRRIGIPKIGAGLAGGDWARIAAIIEEELAGEDVTLVEFNS